MNYNGKQKQMSHEIGDEVFTAIELATMTSRNLATIYMWLSKGRTACEIICLAENARKFAPIAAPGNSIAKMACRYGVSKVWLLKKIAELGLDGACVAAAKIQKERIDTRKKKPVTQAEKIRNNTEVEHLCKCPGCWKMHHKTMFFSGTGTPRIYCPDCNAKAHSTRGTEYAINIGDAR